MAIAQNIKQQQAQILQSAVFKSTKPVNISQILVFLLIYEYFTLDCILYF